VVTLCLEQTGNHDVADWRDYLDRHPQEKPKRKRGPMAEAPEKSNVIPFRPRATEKVPATRRAREMLDAHDEGTEPSTEADSKGEANPEVTT
jgi:hypothetical protein